MVCDTRTAFHSWKLRGILGRCNAELRAVTYDPKPHKEKIVTIEERLDRLERELLPRQDTEKIQNVIRARRIEVVNEKGIPIAEILSEKGAGILKILDAKGQAIVAIGSLEGEAGGGNVRTYDAQGEELVWIGALNGGSMHLYGTTGGAFLELGATGVGDGVVTVSNSKGQELVQIGASEEGTGSVTTYDGKGKELVDIGGSENGGQMIAYDSKGQHVVFISSSEKGGGILTYNRNGQCMVRVGTLNAGGTGFGSLMVNSAEGRTLVLIGESEKGEGEVYTFDVNGKVLPKRVAPHEEEERSKVTSATKPGFIRNNPFRALIIAVVILVFVSTVWPTAYTYTTIVFHNTTVPMRTNRFTGESEILIIDSGWTNVVPSRR